MVAAKFLTDIKLEIPALLDKVDDEVSTAYAAHPDRLYLVGKDGRIAFAGERGPFGFKPNQLSDAILVSTGQKRAGLASTQPDATVQGRSSARRGPGGFRPGGAGFLRRIPLMNALDTDQDGEISAREIENTVAALKGLDKDKDGELSADELRPSFGGRR